MLISQSVATLLMAITLQTPREASGPPEKPPSGRLSEPVVVNLPRDSMIYCPDEKQKDFDGVFGTAAFLPDGKSLVLGNSNGVVKVVETESGRHRISFRASDQNQDRCDALAMSHDGKMIAVPAKKRGQVATMDPASGRILREMQISLHDLRPSSAKGLAFSRDGKMLAGGLDWSGETLLWEVATGRWLDVVPPQMIPGDYKRGGHDVSGTVQGVAFSPDGATLYISGYKLLIWDVKGSQTRHSEWPDGAYAGDLKISPDGTLLAVVGSFRKPVRGLYELIIVDAATGRILNSVEDSIVDAKFFPDNRMILTVVEVDEGRKKRQWVLRLRETATLRLIATIRFEDHFQIGSVAISPDGKTIAAGGCSRAHPFGVIGMAQWDGAQIRPWRPKP